MARQQFRSAIDLVHQRRAGYLGCGCGTLASNWNVAQIGDYNGDGKSDILLLDGAGYLAVWLMNGSTVSSSLPISNVGRTWQVQSLNDN